MGVMDPNAAQNSVEEISETLLEQTAGDRGGGLPESWLSRFVRCRRLVGFRGADDRGLVEGRSRQEDRIGSGWIRNRLIWQLVIRQELLENLAWEQRIIRQRLAVEFELTYRVDSR